MNTANTGSVGLRVERLDDRDVPSAVVADYGGSGVWRYTPGNGGGWVQLTAANPDANGLAVANGGNTVVADFGAGGGLWRWTSSGGWVQMSGVDTEGLQLNDNGDLFADFGAAGGLWRWSAPPSGWVQLSGLNAEQISSHSSASGPSILAADFGASGLWRWTPAVGWMMLSVANAEDISVAYSNGRIFADFGTGGGVWEWTPPGGFTGAYWTQIFSHNPQGMSAGASTFGNNVLYMDRGSMGVWSNGTELSSTNPDQVAGGDQDMYADFGTAGIWRYTINGTWLQLNFADAEFIAVG
jgi:hypothetical protein